MDDPVIGVSSSKDRAPGSDRALIGYTVVALVVALVIRFFIATPYVVSGSSMEPTFHDWDYLIIDRVSYRFDEPQRGDVIVFGLPQEPSRSLIKRIIGLPGDLVTIGRDQIIIIDAAHPGGFIINEPYLDPADRGGAAGISVVVPPGEYFVLGDNRKVSADSRLWGFLPRSDIAGRVLLRLYPLDRIGLLPGVARYGAEPSVATSTR